MGHSSRGTTTNWWVFLAEFAVEAALSKGMSRLVGSFFEVLIICSSVDVKVCEEHGVSSLRLQRLKRRVSTE